MADTSPSMPSTFFRSATRRAADDEGSRQRRRTVRLAIVVLAGILVGIAIFAVVGAATRPQRTTPIHDPPVLAGQHLWGYCSGGFYARLDDTIVLTSSGHCASEGTVATAPDGATVRGVFGPAARSETCPHEGKTCAASDMNYLVVEPDQVPWGRLNLAAVAGPPSPSPPACPVPATVVTNPLAGSIRRMQ